MGSPPQIHQASILVYRVFDIADAIDLIEAERILRETTDKGRLSLATSARQSLIVRNAPLRLGLGTTSLQVGDSSRRIELSATLWDYGVVSVLFQFAIPPGTSWSDLLREAEILGSDRTGILDVHARNKSREIARTLEGALSRPREQSVFEDYTIFFFQSLEGVSEARSLLDSIPVAELILGEPRETLSAKSRQETLENFYQYSSRDLAVIDWNSAVVYDQSGSREITDVLEFALTHLLEFRYYDDLLDQRLRDLYNTIEQQRRGIFRSRFAQISREANKGFMEFSEFIERVDNSLKVVGDYYLAIIFRAAIRRFRIPDWQQSVTRKMNLLARVSQLLQGEVNVNRGFTLELIIVLLIAFEIVQAIFKRM